MTNVMAEWREEGVVQDSDEEEDLALDWNSRIHGVADHTEQEQVTITSQTPAVPAKTAERDVQRLSPFLEQNIDTHQQHVDTRLAQALHSPIRKVYTSSKPNAPSQKCSPFAADSPPPPHTSTAPPKSEPRSDVWDVPSSPLSDPPDVIPSPQASPDRFAQLVPLVAIARDTGHLQDGHESATTDAELDDIETARGGENGFSRTFRKRNPIQLHPYLLENEMYRNTLRARGVRPVHVAPNTAQEDTQNFESQAVVHSSSQTRSSPPPPDNSSPRPGIPSPASSQTSASDDFPDLAALMRQQLPDHLRVGHKKRKLHRSGGNSHTEPNGLTRDAQSAQTNLGLIKRRHKKRFKVPRSLESPGPMHTRSSNHSEYDRRQLGTPSSTRTQNLQSLAASESDTAPAAQSPRPRLLDRDSTQYISSSSDSEDQNVQLLQRQQRRIRGVLPASWLKLDMAARSSTSNIPTRDEQPPVSPPKTQPHRGVARRINRPAVLRGDQTPSLGKIALPLSSDSEPDEEPEFGRNQAARERETSSLTMALDDDPGISMEDNSIDYMQARRWRSKSSTNRKRQTRLTDTFANAKKPRLQQPDFDSARGQLEEPKASRAVRSGKARPQALRERQSRRRPVPRLSLLDVPQSTTQDLPSFVTVARRHVRRRRDQGRHSPSRKLLSLHNQQDGAEMDDTLQDWHQGHIRFQNSGEPASGDNHRPPLRAVDANVLYAGSQEALDVRKSPSHRTTKRSQHLTSKSGPRQGRSRQTQTQIDSSFRAVVSDPLAEPIVLLAPDVSGPKPNHKTVAPTKAAVARRQGQLEVIEQDIEADRRSAFHRTLLELERPRHVHGRHDVDESNPVIGNAEPTTEEPRIPALTADKTQPSVRTRRVRKRVPKRIDPRQVEPHRSVVATTISEINYAPNDIPRDNVPANDIAGLGRPGARHSTDFGVAPLPVGVFFRSYTFLGSGKVKKAFQVSQRDLDRLASVTVVTGGSHTAQLGPWTEDVADVLRRLFDKALLPGAQNNQDLQGEEPGARVNKALEILIEYTSKSLSFLDPIDRRSYLTRVSSLVSDCYHACTNESFGSVTRQNRRLQILVRLLIVTAQLCYVGDHSSVDADSRDRASKQLQIITGEISVDIVNNRHVIKAFHQREAIQMAREHGISNEGVFVEATVILSNALEWLGKTSMSFWSSMNEAMASLLVKSPLDIRPLEDYWHSMFAIIATQEIDASGLLVPGSRFNAKTRQPDDFDLVRSAVQRTFEAYVQAQNPLIMNEYIRVALSRCHRLVQIWGWYRCEPLLNSCFDFFAQRGLRLLRGEESTGSCAFLERLDERQALYIEPCDRSFQIFLKLLATGLTQLRQIHPAKKIRNIAFRFLPNHGRMHHKNEDLQAEDLDALRNNHDLLCVLYSYCPPTARLSLQKIRDLVNFQQSHTELCRLNVKAWANLVRFQVSTDEPLSAMDIFKTWFNAMIDGCLVQHRSAKTEAESFIQSKLDRGQIVSRSMVDATVSSNQREIESVVQALLGSLRLNLAHAKQGACVRYLFEGCAVSKVLSSGTDATPLSSQTLLEALSAYEHYLKTFTKAEPKHQSQQSSEDSQDYGEWPSDDDLMPETPSNLERVADEIQSWLSNAFGADIAPNDSLLVKTVSVAASAATLLVQKQQRDWSIYLEDHGRFSWQQLRDTAQSRSLGPLYLSCVIENEPSSFHQYETVLLTRWLVSLAERESLLKFQHRLTSALLNRSESGPMLHNMPFARSLHSGKFEITLDELRERRLSLVASFLSNLRSVYDTAGTSKEVRDDLVRAVRHFMQALRRNFEELQAASGTLRGAYVTFVQDVVQVMQQYTADICPIDRFFTSALPLPVADPLYVVGRLRAYHLKAKDLSSQKKLAMFVQNTCERAAADGQELYLASQVLNAVDGIRERSGEVSLKQLLLGSIFPAYIAVAMTTVTGWIVARPMLIAAGGILSEALFTMDSHCKQQQQAAASYLEALFVAARSTITPDGHIPEPQTAEQALVLTLLFNILSESLSLLDLLTRQGTDTRAAQSTLRTFSNLSSTILGSSNSKPRPAEAPHSTVQPQQSELQSFAHRELAASLARAWSRAPDGSYSVHRHGARRDVAVALGALHVERARVRDAAARFARVLALMPALRRCGRSTVEWSTEVSRRRASAWAAQVLV